MKNKLLSLVRSQPVAVISFIAALATVFIVPPDSGYKNYINITVLIQLFALMTAVEGLRSAGIFDKVTRVILRKAGNVRKLALFMTVICFLSSMVITNDVALITFVPLTFILFEGIADEKSRIITIVMETVAANLGSMMTPVGNPQNLFLYDEFGLSITDFAKTMLPVGLAGLGCVLVIALFLPKTPCPVRHKQDSEISEKKTIIFSVLFIVCMLSVLRVLPDYICLGAAVAAAIAADIKLLRKVDYSLLATFVFFFIFVGNISRIETVNSFFAEVFAGREMLISVLLSQVISNVPAAVMLAGFTENGTALMLGVDMGGLGTVIASLASLISFQFYRKSEGARPGRYLLIFSVINFAILAVLLGLKLVV